MPPARPISLPVVLGLLLAAGLHTGCGVSRCERKGQPAQTYSDGTVSADGTLYESTAWNGTFLDFPPGRTYNFEHGLGEVPTSYNVYLAFHPEPLPDGEKGAGVSESAGNQAVVEIINDEIIQVRNDTCADFFVRVVAQTGGAAANNSSPDGADVNTGDAGASENMQSEADGGT